MHSPESEIPPINKPEATNESQGVVRIPLIITNRMEADLRGRGYRQEEIDRMKPEEAHAILNQKEKERIVSAIEDELDSVGVRSLAHKRTIKLVMAECELALMRAHSSAPKDEKGAILPESQAFLRQEYSRIIAEADKKILGLINRVRSKEKLVALPPLVAERLSRLSKTDAEQAEFNEALRLLAERDRRSVRTSPPAPVAKPAEVGENKETTMPRESSPAGPEKKEVRPTIEELGLSQKTQELINAVFTLCQKEAAEQIASVKTIKDPETQRRIIEGWYNDAGSMVEKYIREDFERRGKHLPEDFRFPKEYVDRLPGRAYLYEGKSLDELSEDSAESAPDRGSGREEHRKGGASRSRPDSKEAKIKVEAPFDEARPLDSAVFVQFLINRYSETGDSAISPEEMAVRVEAFKQYQERVKVVADFFADQLAQEGIVKVTPKIRTEIRLEFESFFSSQLRSNPELAGNLVEQITAYREAPSKIAAKERVLAELGNQDENRKKRDELVEARRKREALQSEYGKGIFRSFFAGFWRGMRGKEAPRGTPDSTAVDSEKRNFAGRAWGKMKQGIGRGWKVGREAMLRAERADRELNEKGFRKLTEALDAGLLDELEKKIQNAEDAERVKRDMAGMFTRAREVIFEGIGELSSVAEKMRRQTREVFARMVGDEKATIESLQISFDDLSAARKRIEGSDELIGLTPEDIDRTIDELDRLIEAQFVKDIERAITEGFTKDRPFSFLVKMLGKYARLERLGSKHSKEVREFFEEAVEDYSASGRDIDPAKRLMLRQLITALEGESVGEGASTREAEHAVDSSVAAKSAEKEKGKVLVPGVGDEFKFRFKDGDKEYVDKNAKITKVYFKSKDAPRPSEKLRVEGHYRKNGKMKRYNSVITYAQYIVLKKKTQEGGSVMKGEKVRTERGGEEPKVKNETSTGRPSVKDESREPRVDKAQPETPVEAPLEEKRESEQFYNLEEAASVTQLRPDQLQRILEAWRIRADHRKSGDYEIRFERRVIDRIARIRQVIREMPDRAEFYNFDQAVKLLGIEPERMRSLIEDGDVRTFREGADPKFKVNEINGLAGIADPYIQEILKQGLEK